MGRENGEGKKNGRRRIEKGERVALPSKILEHGYAYNSFLSVTQSSRQKYLGYGAHTSTSRARFKAEIKRGAEQRGREVLICTVAVVS